MDDVKRLEHWARFFGSCTLIALAVLLLWGLILLWGVGFIHRLQGPWLAVSEETFGLIFYCLIGLFKLLALTCFLIPWIALRLQIRRLRRG